MKQYTNEKGDYRKPYFFLTFDPSLSEDLDTLNDFYEKTFKDYDRLSKEDYKIHTEYPDPKLQKHANTGYLLSCSISQGLEQILRGLRCTRSHCFNNGKQVKLKSFRYLDGKVKNTQIVARAVKRYNEGQKITRFDKESFIIIHFFNLQQGANKPEQAQQPRIQQNMKNNLPINNLKPDPILPYQQVKQEKQSIFKKNNDNIKSEYQHEQKPSNQKDNNNSTNDQLNRNQQEYQQNNKNQQEQNSNNYDEKPLQEKRNFNAKNSIKQEYLELDKENQLKVLQDESNYYKKLYEKEKIEMNIKLHESQLKYYKYLQTNMNMNKNQQAESNLINLETE